ncbi:MAG: tRNA (adenosine(37)-N6)-dimethylallyltransferase MiaA [Patescibacteria group bacterium]|nr:tRNA (adenosine(37)-N6)-dimethylallyltransferase MiaA [Patescibacteria group bacterium]
MFGNIEMMIKKFKVVAILGPTSSGKSDIAIKLAKDFNGEVISADSRQIYKNMNLGTGKVKGKWKKIKNRKIFVSEKIPHHIIDFRSPRGEYNISHFQKDCFRAVNAIVNRGKLPIICGGTGFWLSAIVDNRSLPQVKPNFVLRKKLNKKTAEQLFGQLKELDTERSRSIDRRNKVRLIRAIEICKKLGKIPRLEKTAGSKYQFLQIGIDWPPEKLDKKIKERLDNRWQSGMVKEVKYLKKKHALSWRKIQSFGLIYFWIPEFLRNKIDEKQLKEKVFLAERNYAKRQRTWFKRDKRIIWQNQYPKIKIAVKKFLA